MGPLGLYYLHYEGHRRRKEKEVQKTFKEIMVENFPNLQRKQISRSKKSREFQLG